MADRWTWAHEAGDAWLSPPGGGRRVGYATARGGWAAWRLGGPTVAVGHGVVEGGVAGAMARVEAALRDAGVVRPGDVVVGL